MRTKATSDLWWKNAIVYCLDVETFLDSNGDGIGDFGGLTERIDYLAGLGVTCVWLMPFYPSRERDDGYDITDFYGVDAVEDGVLPPQVAGDLELHRRGRTCSPKASMNGRCSWPTWCR